MTDRERQTNRIAALVLRLGARTLLRAADDLDEDSARVPVLEGFDEAQVRRFRHLHTQWVTGRAD